MREAPIFDPFLNSDPILLRLWREISSTTSEFINDPRRFIIEAFSGEAGQEKRRKLLMLGLCFAAVFYLIAIISLQILQQHYPLTNSVVEASDAGRSSSNVEVVRLLSPSLPGSSANGARGNGGGGGGGRQEQSPASKGRLPIASLGPQILPPSPHPSTVPNPSLPVAPTISMDPRLLPPQPIDQPVGLPAGASGPPSSGPGMGGGIGAGAGTGVGQGKGTGIGPGTGAGIGSGRGRNIGDKDSAASTGAGDIVYTSGSGITLPKILYKVKPQVTEEAIKHRVQGNVVLMAVFRADGQLSDIRVIQSLGYGLDEEAIKAAMQIKFIPATKNGEPINFRGQITFPFTLGAN